jgi:hypothetical protein
MTALASGSRFLGGVRFLAMPQYKPCLTRNARHAEEFFN